MDDPNMTMEEYIMLKEEKARRRGRVFNWQTATYEKIRIDDDLYDLSSVEAKFPAIVINDAFAPQDALQCESQKKKMKKYEFPAIVYNDAQTSKLDDLDYFKDFENEFLAIVYNNAQTSKSDLLTEPISNPQRIDEFNLKEETSLSECDKEEQSVLNFNDLFPFNVIYPNDSKSDEDNDDDKFDIEHSSEDLSVKPLPDLINIDVGAYAHRYQYGVSWRMDTAYQLLVQYLGSREGNIDEYWCRIYKSRNFEVLES
ncbi:hypothetical protein Tco_0633882 [Tanacetum coccineum]